MSATVARENPVTREQLKRIFEEMTPNRNEWLINRSVSELEATQGDVIRIREIVTRFLGAAQERITDLENLVSRLKRLVEADLHGVHNEVENAKRNTNCSLWLTMTVCVAFLVSFFFNVRGKL